ncbi:Hsp20/alpha crystallin family protein [Herbidospora yilanensis]|uniref:Hsp20/alpha crystallin family protein n=1 Tax=Herbidospora yilanensis TaxID=354426 RepID=UPI00078608BB|nr:Hsp20/alpha crystallin family protein [Herbidospora yilanensis]
MSTLMRREKALLPDIFDLFENPFLGLRAMQQPVRFEDVMRDGEYVLRAELPGVDPEKDVEVTVADGILTVHAERHREESDAEHSEFRYGSLTRSVALPPTAMEEEVTAVYDKGILEVTVKLGETKKESATRVPITGPKETPRK